MYNLLGFFSPKTQSHRNALGTVSVPFNSHLDLCVKRTEGIYPWVVLPDESCVTRSDISELAAYILIQLPFEAVSPYAS